MYKNLIANLHIFIKSNHTNTQRIVLGEMNENKKIFFIFSNRKNIFYVKKYKTIVLSSDIFYA